MSQLLPRFYSLDRIGDLRLDVLSFKQKDNETLGKSWKRFFDLLESGPNLNLEDPVLLFHFFQGLQKDHKQMLHTMSSGSFFRIPTDDARVILDRILEAKIDNILHDETHKVEVDTLPNSPSTLAIPSSEPQKEEIPPPNFMLDIESDILRILETFHTTILLTDPKTAILVFVCQLNIN